MTCTSTSVSTCLETALSHQLFSTNAMPIGYKKLEQTKYEPQMKLSMYLLDEDSETHHLINLRNQRKARQYMSTCQERWKETD